MTMSTGPSDDFSAELERIGALPLEERASELSRVFDQLKDMLDTPEPS